MHNIIATVIDQTISSSFCTEHFACPPLPRVRVDVEVDLPSYLHLRGDVRLPSLQALAHKLLDNCRKEIRWAIEHQDYLLHAVASEGQGEAWLRLNQDLLSRCQALRTRCETAICQAVFNALVHTEHQVLSVVPASPARASSHA